MLKPPVTHRFSGRANPFQTWPTVSDVPSWNDLSPRLGVSYDVFGTGKTALKATASRYVVLGQVGLAVQNNPLLYNATASRSWNDANRNYIPDCNLQELSANGECGALSNPAFGTARGTSRPDDAIRKGWGVRPYNWEFSAGVQHEVAPKVSMDVSYFRRQYGNFTVVDNLAVTPRDYSEYCVVAPVDPRLPGGGGDRICGLYDVNRIVVPNNLVTSARTFGKQTETYAGIDAAVTARGPRGVTVSGGVSSGTSNNVDSINSRSNCFVVDSPGQLRFCDVDMPWRTNVRFLAAIRLPWDIDAGATYASNPGPQITASYTVLSPQVEFVDSTRTGLTLGSATIPLIAPGAAFGKRMTQVDLRLGKNIRYKRVRLRALLDINNMFNSNAVLVLNTTYGSNWQRPTYVLPGRLVKPSLQLDF